jgi:hypothetical protein
MYVQYIEFEVEFSQILIIRTYQGDYNMDMNSGWVR